jgi:glucosyl-3-phosphoglycerate synthase
VGSEPGFTFAVIGRNERSSLPGMLEQSLCAARDGDVVWFVDSASTDGSAAVAAEIGVPVVTAPIGKGAAIATALSRCRTRYICFVDADLFESSVNIPATLRAEIVQTGADMVVGAFSDGRRRMVMPHVYWPLVDALLPEYARLCDPTPLSGQRVLDATLPIGNLPQDYGVETHLNLSFAAAGRRITICELGELRGPLRDYANAAAVAGDAARAILDCAVSTGQLEAALRPEWERWVDDVIATIDKSPPPGVPDEDFRQQLAAVAARPMPPKRAVRLV